MQRSRLPGPLPDRQAPVIVPASLPLIVIAALHLWCYWQRLTEVGSLHLRHYYSRGSETGNCSVNPKYQYIQRDQYISTIH